MCQSKTNGWAVELLDVQYSVYHSAYGLQGLTILISLISQIISGFDICNKWTDSHRGFCFLQAIESFAVTVKDIAQMLQGFGTELAETEVPDKGKAIEYLLENQTAKYRKLKVRFH